MYVDEVLVNCLGGLTLPRKSVVRLTDRPDMTLDVCHGRKTATLIHQNGYSMLGKSIIVDIHAHMKKPIEKILFKLLSITFTRKRKLLANY